ncbi:MAG: hypothetical protein K2L36_03980 [Eubacterium sp.]|nr:hypothetical protein [Eubacterium sp.]
MNNIDIMIEQSMYEFINTWSDKPVDIKLNKLDKQADSMMIQPLSGTEITRKYVNNNYMGLWSFAVYVRVINEDTASRIDARKILQNLESWFTERKEDNAFANLPELSNENTAIKIEMTSAPVLAERYDNGTDDYKAIFNLIFKHKEEK